MTCRRPYDTDLTGREWEQLKPPVPLTIRGRGPPIHSRRDIPNGSSYTVRRGGAWNCYRMWRTVYHYFWSWHRNGTWQMIHDSLRGLVRPRQATGRTERRGH
jgi:putative transposase